VRKIAQLRAACSLPAADEYAAGADDLWPQFSCATLYVNGIIIVQTKAGYKKYGVIWIVISPILWLMAAISSVASSTTYYIQLTCFSIVAFLGLVSGIASLFQSNSAYVVLKALSWLGFIFFSGSGILIIIYGLPSILKGDFTTISIIIPVSVGVVATGLPFYFMARKLGQRNNESI
jgi:hypothetical protein